MPPRAGVAPGRVGVARRARSRRREPHAAHAGRTSPAAHPGWALRLLVGADVLADLPKWHRFDRIARARARRSCSAAPASSRAPRRASTWGRPSASSPAPRGRGAPRRSAATIRRRARGGDLEAVRAARCRARVLDLTSLDARPLPQEHERDGAAPAPEAAAEDDAGARRVRLSAGARWAAGLARERPRRGGSRR